MEDKKKNLLRAGGICFLASGIFNAIPNTKEVSKTKTVEGSLEETNEDSPKCRSVEPRSFAISPIETDPPLTREEVEDSLQECNLSMALSMSPRGRPLQRGSVRFKPMTALHQLKHMMAAYRDDASYEDNFISVSGTRVIFYHFLILIWVFSQIDISMKSLNSETIDSDKCLYVADCLRKYTFRRIPILHHLLPKGVNLKTRTICLVEDQCIVKHKDHYLRMDCVWKHDMPCSKSNWKTLLGNIYTFFVCVFAFFFNLVTFLKTYSFSLKTNDI